MASTHSIELSDSADQQKFDIEVTTPHGVFNLRGALSSKDQALVLHVDTNDGVEPTPDVLRVNVNDGPVFNYDDAVNWHGEDQGATAPTLVAADVVAESEV